MPNYATLPNQSSRFPLGTLAYPLWRANALAGSPAEQLAHAFMGAPVMILFVPWKYVFENYIYKRKEKRP